MKTMTPDDEKQSEGDSVKWRQTVTKPSEPRVSKQTGLRSLRRCSRKMNFPGPQSICKYMDTFVQAILLQTS